MENTTCQDNSSLDPNINSTNEFNCYHNSSTGDQDLMQQVVIIIQAVIASVGIVSNFTVIVAFLNHKKFRQKIPNKFIINQVSTNILFLSGDIRNLLLTSLWQHIRSKLITDNH